ncbi:GNAT family N-acetyltransferase [Anderseniella sp. Alg231-50]|uniref:GNAT family N-acetyltransferase n=1 Tax=Anderseniella sp. Alg231-50 TaxID=1922226 RepID=UPI000D55A591
MNKIVDAGPDHADAVARVHAESWKATYRGILPDRYLDGEVDGERVRYWRAALATNRYPIVKLACQAGAIVGLIALHDDPEDEGYDLTIEHLHLLPESKGRGLGRILMHEAAMAARASGATNICLWVFEDNAAAIGFYERLGGVTDAHGTDKFAGGDAPDRRIGWQDLDGLIARCGGS